MANNSDMRFSTSNVPTSSMGDVIYNMEQMVKSSRVGFERRWYDNNFFDDGFHYRFYSRQANKIIDVSDRASTYAPMRAIPKASRQVRGIANLLVAPDYVPVVYPEKVEQAKFADPHQYQQAMQQAKDYAHKTGRWLIKEWEYQDLIEKLAFMVILSAKHGVSWLQVWPDAVEESIKTQVYDAFDIYISGNITNPSDAPFIIKAVPQLISTIKANENFDEDQLKKISPDNRFASSDIKQAYMATRFSDIGQTDASATLVLKEAYIKEYLNKDNIANIRAQDDGDVILKDRKEGDQVIRQVFVAGNVWLRDRYVNLPDYPFIDFRFEPGPIYQVPLIERFIPLNKSLDALVSRAERYSHTMVAGIWMKKTGEQFKITNESGGQIIDYNGAPPTQGQIAPIPAFFFQLMQQLEGMIQEQGANVSIGGSLPSGVEAHAAIESIKENEYSNLVIPQRRLKNTVKRIAERMLDIADSHIITPKTIYDMKDGNPEYFDVIGASAMEGRKKLKVPASDNVVPLKKDYHVEIEAEQGMAYTKEGQKQAAKQLGDYLIQLATLPTPMVDPNTVKIFFKQLLETYSFGATQEVMEAMEQMDQSGQLTDDQLMKIKVAVLESLKEAGEIGPEAQKNRIMENKIGAMEALQDAGLTEPKPTPPDPLKQAETQQKLQIGQDQHQAKMAQIAQDMHLKQQDADQDRKLQTVTAAHDMAVKEKLAAAQAKQMAQAPKGGSNGRNSNASR
jgi:hypothetical protein